MLKQWRVCCCCRAIVAAKKCLLFEPASASSRKFLEVAAPRLQASEARRAPPALSCLLLEALAERCRQGLRPWLTLPGTCGWQSWQLLVIKMLAHSSPTSNMAIVLHIVHARACCESAQAVFFA